ncbi:S1 family peptidase [Streptomyces sp. NBC_00879]|uniref:trypsin-like serine peptidase n=1 Tax=Streptomyces sp. NBC_00879 TaxID=2975855 RepID=UPI0038643611|nr:S1 family peptidase [Streptomyces sp. NBC_00879]
MRKALVARLTVSLACCALATVATSTAALAVDQPSPVPPSPSQDRAGAPVQPSGGAWSVDEALRFWTPERIASATDPSGRPGPALPGRSASSPRARADVGQQFAGVRSVGILFTVGSDMRAHYCSASTVQSQGRNLILTAGHCLNAKAVFVPQYDSSRTLKQQPYGIWPVEEWFADKRYVKNSRGPESDLDYAFARVKPNGTTNLQDAVGGSTLARPATPENAVTSVGYPNVGRNPQDRPVQCTSRTQALPGYNQMRLDCAGMWDGVSGGPFFSTLDRARGTGEIIGNVGGWNGGGPGVPTSHPAYNRISYSPVYTDRFFQLYDDADNGRHNDFGPYRQPTLPFAMGGWEQWQNARLLATGEFTGEGSGDLIAVWADGSVDLYQGSGTGDPQRPFSATVRLAAPGSVWKNARAIAGGKFTGSGTDGLVVRWSDGELSEYRHVDKTGFHDEKTLAKHKNWQNARLISVGRHTPGALRDDLVVVWANGSVGMYADVDTKAVSKGTFLAKPNKTWPYATQISSGQFTGRNSDDLLVRWADGETTIHPGVDFAGLHGEIKIRPSKSPWSRADVVTAGAFGPDTTRNDVLVRWRDGSVTLHPDVDKAGLHKETKLAR